MPALQLVHITAGYSNAVLAAILPYFSDFAKRLDLPLPLPITVNEVKRATVGPSRADVTSSVLLTNNAWLAFGMGYVDGYTGPDDIFMDPSPPGAWERYGYGKETMTTNQAIELARESVRKLGYSPKSLHMEGPPTVWEPPWNDPRNGRHVPHCHMVWEGWQEFGAAGRVTDAPRVQCEVNLREGRLSGLQISSAKLIRPAPGISVEPELETDYRLRISGVFPFPSNAPPGYVTQAWSNAVLAVVLPFVNQFARGLDLPIQPVAASMVATLDGPGPGAAKGFGGGLWLTNGYRFRFTRGRITEFHSPADFADNEREPPEQWPPSADGRANMSKSEAADLARKALSRLGYSPEQLRAGGRPDFSYGPYDLKDGRHAPHCLVVWQGKPSTPSGAGEGRTYVSCSVDMRTKAVTGLKVVGAEPARPPPKIAVEQELEAYLRNHPPRRESQPPRFP